MSRSFRKSPWIGMTKVTSDKPFKRSEHQRERSAVKRALKAGKTPPSPRLFGDPWDSPKDGKQRIRSPNGAGKRWMRK